MSEHVYDVAVVGGGPGGYAAALRAAVRGAKAAIIESGLAGGTCLNRGCIPSKAILHGSALAYEMGQAQTFGLNVEAVAIDGPAFMQRVNKVVSLMRGGLEKLLAARKVTVIAGRGRLAGPGKINVTSADGGQSDVSAKAIIVATGSRPAQPAVFPWDCPRVITTDEATTAADLPASIVIVGGGVIGCELATAYAELGIATTLVEMLDSLVPVIDTDAGLAITRSLRKRGVTIRTGTQVTGVVDRGDAAVCTLSDGSEVAADRVLVAVGRRPNVEDIGLKGLGVQLCGGIIAVDEHCRTNVPGVWAIGDAAEKLQYAHLASRMGQIAADDALGFEAADDRSVVPMCVYTHPEIAAVGLSEEAARKRCEIVTAIFPYRSSGIAQAYGQFEGQAKLIAEAGSKRLLGAIVIGARSTELITEIGLAMRHGMTAEQVAANIHPHPTFSEAIGEAAESLLGLPFHGLS